MTGCGTPPPGDGTPADATQDDVPQDVVAKPIASETPAERTARLNREADLRAGLDPNKPLAKWDLSAVTAPSPPAAPCTTGTAGQLEITLAGKPILSTTHAELAAGPAAWTPAVARLEGRTVVRVAALVSDGTGPLTAVSCTGETFDVPADQLATPDRWVLVLNPREELKLVDLQTSPGAKKPAARHVTVLRR